MAELESYESIYRKNVKFREPKSNFPHTYHGDDVVRLSDVFMDPPDEDLPSEADFNLKYKCMIAGCGLAASITESLLVHPLIVLKRQCQVNPMLSKYHIIPITLVPVVIRLHQTQGISTLWKGIGSMLLVRGMLLAIEDFISKITPWPKQITCNSSLRAFGQHLLLKCVSIGLITPFYSASLVETVQSKITSDTPGILDVFRDGAIRLVEVNSKGRLIPIYSLLPSAIAYGVSKYFFTLAVRGVTSRIMYMRQKQSQELRGAYSKNLLSETVAQDIKIHSALISGFMAEVLFYPWETVIHRLQLQGTRTIIDNLDTGRNVTPILTGYSGASDCYNTIISNEGPLGLYKGFGTVIVELTLSVALLRIVKWIVGEVQTMLEP